MLSDQISPRRVEAEAAPAPAKKPRLLAIASGGGHWDELVVLRSAFEGYEVVYATTNAAQAERDGINAAIVTDSNRDSGPASTFGTVWQLFGLVRRHNPAVVVSTGAMPGLIGCLMGKVFGARTIWIDSVANAEELSMSGRWATRFVDLHLSQWPHLATGKTKYMGSVL